MEYSTDGDIRRLRDRLTSDFRSFAARDGVIINPSADMVVLDVCERLYDEERGGRRIYIDLSLDPEQMLDWFVKDFGHEKGWSRLLTLSVNRKGINAQQLWSIYKEWMLEHSEAESAVNRSLLI